MVVSWIVEACRRTGEEINREVANNSGVGGMGDKE
jgi:hypothetical protein